ncbi:MAG: DNA repair protein RecN [Treponema sp.]|nr:DNA repair protein RecN [Treponema sp.]
MLEELDIKNFALIDAAHVEFKKGFTVLSGETGAGKSILIGSLAFLLGGKAGLEQIRTGCHEAQVCGTFLLEEKKGSLESAWDWLDSHGIEAEDGRVILRRVVRDTGKTSAWIGGVPVTKADLADFASFLVDLHGQHEQQSLMKVSEHRRYLDIYADIVPEVQAFTRLYTQLVEKRALLDSLNTNETERANKIDMLSFAISEIEEAKLKTGEDEQLAAEESRLASYEKLYSDIEEITSLLEGEDGSGILAMYKRLRGSASHASSLDSELTELNGRIENSFYEAEDIAREFRRYKNELVFDPERLTEVQDRLELINRLKKKYAGGINSTIEDINEYAEKSRAELERLTGQGNDRSSLEKEIALLEKSVYTDAKAISAKRKDAAQKMSGAVEEILYKLGMKDTRFRVSLVEKEGTLVEQKCGPYGIDNIEFLISANPGSPLLPLARIASGGELSRVMLALKTILSAADTAGTLIFDEIDTGIGGEVAVAVGEHMKKLAQGLQVLCITHLASIAVYADNQIKIKKGVEGNSTATSVFPVENEERVSEIARMLSGDSSSEESLGHARAMLQKFGGM